MRDSEDGPQLGEILGFGPQPLDEMSADLGHGVWLGRGSTTETISTVSWHKHRIYRDTQEIGSVDYWACHTCREVLLGEIGLIEQSQRQGYGHRVLEQLRRDLPGYRWRTTGTKLNSGPFWRRMRTLHPGEYYDTTDERGRPCPHVTAAL